MAKIQLSSSEFNMLSEYFQAPKEGKHIRWRDFCDQVDEVFTKKGLEKAVDLVLDDARTKTLYGRSDPSKEERNLSDEVVRRFKALLMKHRLDAKSFFQDFDRHKHFKVSPKQFRQVLANFGFQMSDDEIASIIKNYGNEQNDIQYLLFLNDSNPYGGYGDEIAAKSAYISQQNDYFGEKELNGLLFKIKTAVKKDRIRLLEFFQDHDLLRKGFLPKQKFRGVLHSQKIQLIDREYELLEKKFEMPHDPLKVNYVAFNEDVERIFTEKGLEKDPLKKIEGFNAPSILDPKDVLDNQEEKVLHDCLVRIGTDVRFRRLLMKPFF